MDFFLHLFTPRPSNNHRAKVLHSSTLSLIITGLVVFQILLGSAHRLRPEVLGYASNINTTDLLNDTNSQRATAGVAALNLNAELSQAAAGKATDMFSNQYWAHVSPSGKDPWAFIVGASYNYTFAGENLARDFADSHAVVEAWMNSSTHKENLLNTRFKDVGFAVVNGKYGNEETTLVVQMFGARALNAPSVAAPQVEARQTATVAQESSPTANLTPQATLPAVPENLPPPESGRGVILNTNSTESQPKLFFIDGFSLSKNISTGLLLVLIAVLIIDSAIVYQKKIVRLSGHNFAHLTVLLAVLVALNMIGRGVIL